MIKWSLIKFPPINLWSVWNLTKKCNNKCQLVDNKYCKGCGRSLTEIINWSK